MANIALVTDSTAYIPRPLLEQYRIRVIPLYLLWQGQTYRDGVDIQPEQVYQRMQSTHTMPTTSQVSVTDFQHLFGELLNQDLQILTILISSKLSGTVASALQAQADFPGAPIEVIDSQSIAMAMGFQVLAAARAAAAGANLADCKAIAEQARQHSGIVFAVDTLEFLHRGGRIGGATRWLGSALNLKPVLEITGGRVETVDKVRTRRKSLERVIEVVSERIQDKRPLRLAVGHADALAEAQDVLEAVKTRLAPIESYVTEFSPVAGAHGGPRSLALAYLAGM